MRRVLATILAVLNVANGLTMLFAGRFWFQSVPGAAQTGPFNPHFVQDVGAAFLIAGLSLAARALQPALWPATVAGAGFLAVHGLIHLASIVAGHDHDAPFDVVAVVLPSALALYSTLPDKEKIMRSFFAVACCVSSGSATVTTQAISKCCCVNRPPPSSSSHL